MTEIKVACPCGQKYKFDVEPVNGQMPFAVNCPACGSDGTAAANAILAQQPTPSAAPRPVAAAAFARPVPRAPGPAPAPRAASAGAIRPDDVGRAADEALRAVKARSWEDARDDKFHLGRGVLGAVLGAGLGGVLLIVVALLVHFIFPYSFAGIGALAGIGARMGYGGTRPSLGLLTALVTAVVLVLVGFLLFGPDGLAQVGFHLVVSLAVGVWVAYRIAS